MKVRCKATDARALPSDYITDGLTRNAQFSLTIGKIYIVYAIDDFQSKQFYFIADDSFMYYPMRVPGPLFEVTDSSPSFFWSQNQFRNGLTVTGFPEWISSIAFYEDLVDGVPEAIETFAGYKSKLDRE